MKRKLLTTVVIMYGSLVLMLLFGVTGQAYIDPSVTTYMIQAIAGIAVAVGAAAGLYWRRAKKKLDDKLGIDENKNKEIESDDISVK